MANTNVVLELTASDAKALNAILAVTQRIKGLGGAADDVGKKSDDAGKKGASGFDQFQKKVGNTLLTLGSAVGIFRTMKAGIAEIGREWDLTADKHRRYANQQISVAAAQRGAALALGTGSDVNLMDMTKRVEAGAAGLPLAEVYGQAESALSARGSLSAGTALDIVASVNRYAPHLDADGRKSLGEGATELLKVWGDKSPDQAVAAIFESAGAARTTNLGDFGRNIATAVTQAAAFGGNKDDYQYLASLVTGIGQRAGDPTGRKTKTGTLGFLKQVKEATSGALGDGASVREQLEWLHSEAGKSAREQLVGSLSIAATDAQKSGDLTGEASTYVATREVLQKGSQTWKEIDSAATKISGMNDVAVTNINKLDREMRAMPSQSVAGVSRIMEGGLQQLGQNDVVGALGQQSVDKMRELLVGTGVYGREADASAMLSRLGMPGDRVSAVQSILTDVETRAQYLAAPKPRPGVHRAGGISGMGGPLNPQDRPANELELKNAEALFEVAQLLREQIEIMKTSQPVRITGDSSPPTAPAPVPVGQ